MLLLPDCRRLLVSETVFTEQLLDELHALDERPWGDLRGKALDAHGLARRLRPYNIRPGQIRLGDRTQKGYHRADFVDAWTVTCRPFRVFPLLRTGQEGEGTPSAVEKTPLPPSETAKQGKSAGAPRS